MHKIFEVTIITSSFALRNYTSLHCSTLSTCCIKATVCSIRYFNWQKIGLLFHLINWQLTLQSGYPMTFVTGPEKWTLAVNTHNHKIYYVCQLGPFLLVQSHFIVAYHTA